MREGSPTPDERQRAAQRRRLAERQRGQEQEATGAPSETPRSKEAPRGLQSSKLRSQAPRKADDGTSAGANDSPVRDASQPRDVVPKTSKRATQNSVRKRDKPSEPASQEAKTGIRTATAATKVSSKPEKETPAGPERVTGRTSRAPRTHESASIASDPNEPERSGDRLNPQQGGKPRSKVVADPGVRRDPSSASEDRASTSASDRAGVAGEQRLGGEKNETTPRTKVRTTKTSSSKVQSAPIQHDASKPPSTDDQPSVVGTLARRASAPTSSQGAKSKTSASDRKPRSQELAEQAAHPKKAAPVGPEAITPPSVSADERARRLQARKAAKDRAISQAAASKPATERVERELEQIDLDAPLPDKPVIEVAAHGRLKKRPGEEEAALRLLEQPATVDVLNKLSKSVDLEGEEDLEADPLDTDLGESLFLDEVAAEDELRDLLGLDAAERYPAEAKNDEAEPLADEELGHWRDASDDEVPPVIDRPLAQEVPALTDEDEQHMTDEHESKRRRDETGRRRRDPGESGRPPKKEPPKASIWFSVMLLAVPTIGILVTAYYKGWFSDAKESVENVSAVEESESLKAWKVALAESDRVGPLLSELIKSVTETTSEIEVKLERGQTIDKDAALADLARLRTEVASFDPKIQGLIKSYGTLIAAIRAEKKLSSDEEALAAIRRMNTREGGNIGERVQQWKGWKALVDQKMSSISQLEREIKSN